MKMKNMIFGEMNQLELKEKEQQEKKDFRLAVIQRVYGKLRNLDNGDWLKMIKPEDVEMIYNLITDAERELEGPFVEKILAVKKEKNSLKHTFLNNHD